MVAFYNDKDIDKLNIGFTLPTLSNICLQKSTVPSHREINTCWKKFGKTSLTVHLSFLHAKQLLMKLFFEILQTDANLLLGLKPANSTPTGYVKPCALVFIRVGISIRKPVDSHRDKTRPVASKIWSCFIFNEKDLIVNLGASTLNADGRKLTASVLMGLVLFSILCLKQWVAFTTFVPVKSCIRLSLKKLSDVAVRRENSMNRDEAICRRMVSLSLKCRNVSVGYFTRQPLM